MFYNMCESDTDKVFIKSVKEAIIDSNQENLEILLKSTGVTLLDYRNGYNGTLLHEAAELGSPILTKYFIEVGLNIEAQDFRGTTPLISASKNDNSETRIQIVEILIEAKANVNAMAEGKPALHHFLDNSQRESAILLIEKGADINCKEEKHGFTMLHKAAMRHNNANIFFLLSHNADPRIKSKTGQSTLQFAVQSLGAPNDNDFVPNFEVLKKLLEHGANPNAKLNRSTVTVFHKILQHGDEKIVRLFIKHGAKYGSSKTGKEIRKQALKNKDKEVFDLIVQLQEDDKMNID